MIRVNFNACDGTTVAKPKHSPLTAWYLQDSVVVGCKGNKFLILVFRDDWCEMGIYVGSSNINWSFFF